MKYEYDVLTIGLGPAGMAVAVMASQMGLKKPSLRRELLGKNKRL